MLTILVSLVSFLVAIGIIALVHEFGHFITAKKNGIYVKEFALGFGPKLFGVKKGETEYNIRLLPMAGFVDLAGMDPDEELEEEFKGRGFNSKSAPVRFLILVAGALMNIILAIGIYWGVFAYAGAPKEVKPIVGEIFKDGAASKSALKSGDIVQKIIYFEGKKKVEKNIDKFLDIVLSVATHPKVELTFVVKRNGKILNIPVTPRPDPKKNNLGTIGVSPVFIPSIVGKIVPDGPAAKAGIKPNDKIIKIDDVEINSWTGLRDEVQKSKGKKIKLTVLRNNKQIVMDVVPVLLSGKQYKSFFNRIKKYFSKKSKKKEKIVVPKVKRYYLGIEAKMFTPERMKIGIGGAFKQSIKKVIDVSNNMLTSLYLLFTNKIPGGFKNTMGPVGIASFTGKRAQAGLISFLEWVALLSTYIGLFNLIPFPALDGGRLFFIIIGLIIRKEIPPKTEEKFHTIGFILLLVLIVYVTYNDIAKLFT